MSLSKWSDVVVGKEEEAGRVPRRKEERLTMDTIEHGSCVTYSIQFIEQEQGASLPAPLVRVSFCGMPTLEVLKEVVSTDPPLGRYEVISTRILRGRGVVPSMMLLKLLGSQPHRFATKDWLSTQMQQEMESGALVRLDTIASQLRTLFCGLEHADTSALRLRLVEYLRNGRSSGPGYQLAPYPLIWLDTEALAWNVEQAARMERFGYRQDALPFWQRAYVLASRGSYLPDDPYSEWATDTRTEVQGALRQSVHALGRLYLSLHGRIGEEEAIVLLRNYWLRHKTDQDALRPLLELLGERECYQEAEQYYQLLCEALDATKRGRQPDDRTRDIYEFLRIKQIQRPPSSHPAPDVEEEHFSSAASPQETGLVESIGYTLSDDNQLMLVPDDHPDHAGPLLAETRHLIGRQEWLASVIALIQTEIPKKLLVLHGPIGVGKSSELNRLAHAFVKQRAFPSQVIVLSLPAREPRDPEASLDLFVGMLLSESRAAPFPADASRQTRINLALTTLAQRPDPTVILLDNAEGTLTEEGTLAPCWEAFLTSVVRGQHQATLILATKEWPGWTGRDPQLVAETPVPALTLEDSVLLLQRLGLESVPHTALETISQRVACIPLCLEWIVKIAHDPLVHDAWEGFEALEETSTESRLDAVAQRFARLLQHPTLLGEHLASRLTPLLEHIINRHLSADARRVLEHLSVMSIPLGKSALHAFCSRPAWLKELRSASLLAAYTNRIQLLPMVASTVRARLSTEQVYTLEERMIEALTRWVEDGNVSNSEAGNVVAELVTLLLVHHRLLDVAELLIHHGWQSFLLGHGPRLASFAQEILQEFNQCEANALECARLVIMQILLPFLGTSVDTKQYVDYQRIWNAIVSQKVTLPVAIGNYVIHLLVLDATNHAHFEEAQALLDTYSTSLEHKTLLLTEYAFLLRNWSDYVEGKEDRQQARHLRQQTIDIYKQLLLQTAPRQVTSPLFEANHKRSLAYYLNNLAYHLNIMGMHEEALQMVEQSLSLKEQGFVSIGALAASYGEKAEILIELGRFQEALIFYEKAMADIQQYIDAGDALSQREKWIYQVIRGRLYLRSGNMDKAEQLFREALSHIHTDRRMYCMFAQDGLNEIEQWKQHTVLSRHQLDWRWVERFRELVSYDSRWWLTWAGRFTKEEQEQWELLFAPSLDEATKTQLGTLMKGSRERELQAAIAEQREPRLHYPAIDIQDIRHRIAAQLVLQEEIAKQEPNVVVRRFYQRAIEEELDYLRLIEATHESNSDRFWEYNRRILPLPIRENMDYAFAHVKRVVKQGLENPQTLDLSQQLQEFVHARLHLSLNLTLDEEAHPERIPLGSKEIKPPSTLSAQAAQRFFTTILHEGGYEDWLVTMSQNVTSAHVEMGARHVYFPEKRFSLAEIRHLFIHELAGHVARCIAGDQSPLGLLGIQTKNCLPTEEGIALYYEKQATALRGELFDDWSLRIGTIAVGLACGVVTPPQSFLSLFTFLERYMSLVQLLMYPGANREELQKQMQQYALSICLRVYRGVPHLEQPGICYLQDVVHFHGLRLIEYAVAKDATVLDRLGVGRVALEDLPDIQELGIVSASQPFKQRLFDPDLDAYILSFAQPEGEVNISQ